MPLIFANLTLTVPIAILSESTLVVPRARRPAAHLVGCRARERVRRRRRRPSARGGTTCPPGLGIVARRARVHDVRPRARRDPRPAPGAMTRRDRPDGRAPRRRPPLLEVRDLHVTYRTRAGDVPGRARRVASSSTPGRDARPRRRVGLRQDDDRGRGAAAAARGHRGRGPGAARRRRRLHDEPRPAARGALDRARGRVPGRAARLDPVQRIGKQIAEAIDLHRPDRRQARPSSAVGELLEQVGLPGAPRRRLPAPALGRSAPAGDDRDGARVRSRACSSPTSRPPRST